MEKPCFVTVLPPPTDFHPRRSRTRDGMSSVQCPDTRHTEHRRAWCNHRPSSIYTLDHQLTADYSGQEIYSVERVRGAAQHPPVTCHVSSCHVNLAAISKQTFLRNNPAILSHNGQHSSGRREQRAVIVPTPVSLNSFKCELLPPSYHTSPSSLQWTRMTMTIFYKMDGANTKYVHILGLHLYFVLKYLNTVYNVYVST